MLRVAAFAFFSILIIWVSRRSLRHPASHGFPRFFGFESTLALVLINAPHWFARPFAIRQLISWCFLGYSLITLVWGFILLRREGGFSPAAEVGTTFGWENTGRLVTTGIYRYIRHPLYSSVLFLAWGAFLKSVSPATLTLGVAASAALAATAIIEEAENLVRFGEEYRNYMRGTHRFVPFLL